MSQFCLVQYQYQAAETMSTCVYLCGFYPKLLKLKNQFQFEFFIQCYDFDFRPNDKLKVLL